MDRIWTLLVLFSPISTFNAGYEIYMDGPNTWEDPYWPHNGPAGISQPKCVDIPENLTLCHGIGYTQMRIPNTLGHDNLAEVTQQSSAWLALSNIKCHGDTKLFLCSLFAPICLDKEIMPCRSMCEAVKSGCEKRMSSYGFPWPDMVRCDKFPDDNGLCIKAQTVGNKGDVGKSEDPTCAPCREPDTVEGIIDNFCRADFVMAIKIKKKIQQTDGLTIRPEKKKKAFKKEGMTKKDVRRAKFTLQNTPCECTRVEGSTEDRFLVMGHKKNEDLVLSFVLKWDKEHDKAIRRAMRVTKKKKDICKGGVDVLDVEDKRQSQQNRRKRKKERKEDRKSTSRRPRTIISFDEQPDFIE